MDYLDAVFDLWLFMLERLVQDDVFGAILWIFILMMIALLLLRIWRGVWGWKRY